MIIDLPRFLSQARPRWTELQELLDRMERQPDRGLSLEEARRFHLLYQRASADLAQLHTFASEPNLRRYLEGLVARAYGEVHGGGARGAKWKPMRWFLEGFPKAFRHRWRAAVLACLITFAGMLFGGGALLGDPDAKRAIMPGQFANHLGDPAKRVAAEESARKDERGGAHITFAGELMSNNIRVSINAVALGMLWGIGTAILLLYNGIILGLVAVDYIQAGHTVFLLGWLLPHGIIEIPAILIAGQGGLTLGGAILGTGSRATLAARLRAVGPDVASLIGGVAVMLVWAGLVESFLSQYHQPVVPYAMKIAFGVLEGVGLVWLLSGWGREKI